MGLRVRTGGENDKEMPTGGRQGATRPFRERVKWLHASATLPGSTRVSLSPTLRDDASDAGRRVPYISTAVGGD